MFPSSSSDGFDKKDKQENKNEKRVDNKELEDESCEKKSEYESEDASVEAIEAEDENETNEDSDETNQNKQSLDYSKKSSKYSKQQIKVDKKVRRFFKKFSKKSTTENKNPQPADADGQLTTNYDIEYGNVKDKYDPQNSITALEESYHEDNNTSAQLVLSMIKNSKTDLAKSSSQTETNLNINDVNLVRKGSLINLIERNRVNQLCCPFDEIFYYRFLYENYQKNIYFSEKKMKNSTSFTASNQGASTYEIDFFNEHILETLQSLKLNTFDPNLHSIEKIMPNSVATFLMQFFFDIFQPSELKLFQPKTLEIILTLKSLYKPQIRLDKNLITCYVPENILWNCFALFQFKFKKVYNIGFLNYYFSLFYIIQHLESDNKTNEDKLNDLKKAREIKSLAPYFIEALILNGLFDQNTYKNVIEFQYNLFSESNKYSSNATSSETFFSQSQTKNSNLQENLPSCILNNLVEVPYGYLDEAVEILKKAVDVNFPMKLKHLSRIAVKQSIKDFNIKTVDSLEVPDLIKSFLMFSVEFEHYYNESKSIINQKDDTNEKPNFWK